MPARPHPPSVPKALLVVTALYFLASLGHFAHNAEFLCEYPKLPSWLTRAQVYLVWAANTAVGVIGLLLLRSREQRSAGLIALAAYAALGFDGLGHYALAPIVLHSWGANVTILSEVGAAASLLAFTLVLLGRDAWQWSSGTRHPNMPALPLS